MQNFDRRSFIRIGSLSLFGYWGWGDVLRLRAQSPAPAKRDISVIHLWLTGGMSQLDTFDPKPEAGTRYRSPFKPIATKASGIRISEHLPRTAQVADKFVIIRSMTHRQAAHEAACNLILSGHEPLPTIQHPAMQTVIAKELGARNELPAAVSIPGATGNWEKAGFLGPQFNPFNAGNPNADNFKVRDMDLPMGVDWTRMDHRRSLLSVVDERFRQLDTTGIGDSMEAYYQTAFGLMRSEKAKKAFQISEEPTLANDFLPELDRAFASLVEDLDRRGMLDTTLVIVTGEFGRTPEINAMGGRDHWPNAFSLALAGSGITGGRVLGESDDEAMFVKDHPVEVPDLVATLYRKLGIDYNKEYISNIGRPVKLSKGQPIEFLMV